MFGRERAVSHLRLVWRQPFLAIGETRRMTTGESCRLLLAKGGMPKLEEAHNINIGDIRRLFTLPLVRPDRNATNTHPLQPRQTILRAYGTLQIVPR
jgi:hypothetical protein